MSLAPTQGPESGKLAEMWGCKSGLSKWGCMPGSGAPGGGASRRVGGRFGGGDQSIWTILSFLKNIK